MMIFDKQLLPYDISELEELVQEGNSKAIINLALKYKQGQGTAVDYEKAVHYFKMADDLDNILGSYNLANMYMQDLGVEKDEDKALSLYKKATLNCDDISAHNYAMFFLLSVEVMNEV